ncbi:MAG TPA: YihY/virulence factor BrkB family protein [Novosphingobium sp.]|mgnify:CR=1 FL=1|nr:YihY/virulence factor BrkB family protein [Novosphingobium sp.]
MEERPADGSQGHPDFSPEGRRRAALKRQIEASVGPGSRAFEVLRRVGTGAWHDGFIHAGNLAYMALLSLFPFCIALTAILVAIGEPQQRDASIDAFLTALPPVVRDVLSPVAHEVASARSGMLLWIGGLVGLWTATSLLETIRDILHRAYGTPQTQAFWLYRLLSSGMIFAATVLLMVSLFAQVAIVTAQQAVAAWFPGFDGLVTSLSLGRWITAGALYLAIFMLFAALTPAEYRGKGYPKWPGALLVTAWWVAITIGLPAALRWFLTYDLTYGSLAGVMIALFFFWLVGLGIVVGAELNAALTVSPEERALRARNGIGSRNGNGEGTA